MGMSMRFAAEILDALGLEEKLNQQGWPVLPKLWGEQERLCLQL